MRCNLCQTENPPTARVCTRCGAGLTASAAGSALAGTGGFTGGPISDDDSEAPTLPQVPPGSLPARFESYEILRKDDGSLWELGRGAMGITYKAIDTDLQVPVALKVINPNVIGSRDASERFLREARSAAKLRHGNIASVFRLGRAGDTLYYAMEFCEGQTVHQLVDRRGALELRLALEITRQVAAALVVAQDHGVVHRDIKPSNLMVTGRVPEEFTVKVIDFGLAKHTAPDSAAIDISVASDRAGFVGTAHFASPEQLEDRPVDFRSDIYSLGVTLWFMLTGRPLFEGSLTRVVTQHIAQKAPLEKLPWLPPMTLALMESMLAKEVEARPESARALRDQIQMAMEEADLDVTSPARSDVRPVFHPPSSLRSPSGAGAAVPPPISTSPSVPPPIPSSSPGYGSDPASGRPPQLPVIPPIPPLPATPPGLGLPPAPPPSHFPPGFPAPPASTPARPKPTSIGPFLVVGLLLLLLALGGVAAVFAYKTLAQKTQKTQNSGKLVKVDPNDSTPGTQAPRANDATPSPGLVHGMSVQDAVRELRIACDSAEKLSKCLLNSEINQALIQDKQEFIRDARMGSSARESAVEALNQYQAMDANNENAILDAENRYLLAARRIAEASDETLSTAFETLERDVSRVGINTQTQIVQLMRRHIINVPPDAKRLDSDFRESLKQLQKR